MKVKAKQGIHAHALDEFDNQNLVENKIYDVIGISTNYFRVVDEMWEPILYPKYLFDVIDASIPEWWIRKEYSADEYYINPPEFTEPGFYEDYFDGIPEAKDIYYKFLLSAGLAHPHARESSSEVNQEGSALGAPVKTGER